MALPYVLRVTCIAINIWPGATVSATTDYARVHFRVADAESSADRFEDPEQRILQPLIINITQAQKDDFTVGADYDIDITAA